MSKVTKTLNLDEAINVDTASSTLMYIGKAIPLTTESEAKWKIIRMDSSSGVIVKFAGTGGYTEVWDDRASLSYS